MPRATELAHAAVRAQLKPGDWAIDATVGNGHDTLFLTQCVGAKGAVFGFDVQVAAIAAARERLLAYQNVTLVHAGHEFLTANVPPEAKGNIAAVMFNLGYLPGGDHSIVTRRGTTLLALTQALDVLAPRGIITLVLYPGHPGGEDEGQAVREFATALPGMFDVSHYAIEAALAPAPELVVIRRVG